MILRRTSLRIASVTRHVNHSPSLNTDVFGRSRPSLEALGKIGRLEALALKERLCNHKCHLGIVGVLAFFPQRGRHHFPEALWIARSNITAAREFERSPQSITDRKPH